jgi:hypothetical protein
MLLTAYASHPTDEDGEVRLDIEAIEYAPVRGVWSEWSGCVIAPEPGRIEIDAIYRDGDEVSLSSLTPAELRAVDAALADPRGHAAR